ncbi:hypothetical protein BGX26_002213 [Mortierella sp. AD094]|nr:hypothetical protein BGX26_002213 [Mortierella sp. AD094]
MQAWISNFADHEDKPAENAKEFDPIKPSKIEDVPSNGETLGGADRKGKRKKKESTESTSDSATNAKKRRKGVAKSTSDAIEERNQIEVYLDSAFGGKHEAKINPVSRYFEANKDGVKLDDSKTVCICGLLNTPHHTGKVKRFPDILHVNGIELKNKLFGDLYRVGQKQKRPGSMARAHFGLYGRTPCPLK